MKIKHLVTIAILLCHGLIIDAMELSQEYNTHLVVVPDQNGMGGQNAVKTLPYFENKPHLVHYVETPNLIIDLGQNRCMQYLKQKMSLLTPKDKAIIHASSQGTATTLNYTSKYPEKIGALILESIMISGNSAISYNVPAVNKIPGSYYILPYLAKFQFPFYAPAGEQPIMNVNKLPNDLPIIILHHENDPQLSYQDAQALYAFLKHTQKNKNVYLMSKKSDEWGHVLLLNDLKDNDNLQKITIINKILVKNKLLPKMKNFQISTINSELISYNIDYQPKSKQEWLELFENIRTKETIIWYIDWPIKIIFYGLIFYRFI
jgi:predicted esterase